MNTKLIRKIILSAMLVSLPACFLGLLIWQMKVDNPNPVPTSIKHTVKFMDGDAMLTSFEVSHGERCPQYRPYLADGILKLNGWKQNNDAAGCFDFTTPITKDVTLYANYSAVLNYDLMISSYEPGESKIIGTHYVSPFSSSYLSHTESNKFVATVDLNFLESDEQLGPNVLICDDLDNWSDSLIQPTDLEMWIGERKLVENVDYEYVDDATYTNAINWLEPIKCSNQIMTIVTTFDNQWDTIKGNNHNIQIEIRNPFID